MFAPHNRKYILITGFSRGGTNLAWNLLQSHPDITTPILELGELCTQSRMLRSALKGAWVRPTWARRVMAGMSLNRWNSKTLSHVDNRYRTPDEIYTQRELSKTALCLKSVDDEIRFTPVLAKLLPGLKVIGLARHGHSLCEGHVRRGTDVETFARRYQYVACAFKNLVAEGVPVKIFKFEQMTNDPFAIAGEMLDFVEIAPSALDRIRLKSKRVMGTNGEYSVKFGEEGRKTWFDRDNILQALDQDVNAAQRARLSEEQLHRFDSIAHDAMKFFGYA